MEITRRCWKCEICEHEWIAQRENPPNQCAKCRSRKWHTGIKAIQSPVYHPLVGKVITELTNAISKTNDVVYERDEYSQW